MNDNIIAALIGVGSSVIVFIATIIANYIDRKVNLRNEIKKAHSDELCEIIKKNINIIMDVKYGNNHVLDNIILYSKKALNAIDRNNILEYETSYLKNIKPLVDNINTIVDYLENHAITLSEFKDYSIKIKKINLLYFDLNEEYLLFQNDYVKNKIENLVSEEGIKKFKLINNKYNKVYDELYFYYYNLNVSLQNSIYSKYFKNKKIEKLKNDLYEVID